MSTLRGELRVYFRYSNSSSSCSSKKSCSVTMDSADEHLRLAFYRSSTSFALYELSALLLGIVDCVDCEEAEWECGMRLRVEITLLVCQTL